MRKTDWIYGAVVKAIRDVAGTGKEFCACEFDDPVRTHRMLLKLVRNGELKRVSSGRAGKELTVYQKA